MASISSEQFISRSSKLGSEGSAYKKNRESVHRNFPKIKQEVSAFGPKHAEYGRIFYQSKRTQPKRAFGRSLNQKKLYTYSLKSQVRVSDTSQPYETILKIAKISPRPGKKQPTETKASFGFGLKLLNHTVERESVKKSYDFQDCECEIDLSKTPLFQIFFEISNTQ